jgi:hypothetical protein
VTEAPRIRLDNSIAPFINRRDVMNGRARRPATTARYGQSDNDPLRRASNAIAKAIADAMDGNVAVDSG